MRAQYRNEEERTTEARRVWKERATGACAARGGSGGVGIRLVFIESGSRDLESEGVRGWGGRSYTCGLDGDWITSPSP